jgi:hypothetical protein
MDPMKRRAVVPMMVVAALSIAACTSTEAQPPDSPSGSASPVVQLLAPEACPDFSCEGSFEVGRYRAVYYDPAFEFEIASPGWSWAYTGNFQILATHESAEGRDRDGINFFIDPSISSQDCEDGAEPGIGRSVDELVAWVQAAPGLTVSDPTPVTVGGLDGIRLDLALDPAWKQTCFFSKDEPTVPLIYSPADVVGYNWAIGPGMSMRWFVLDSDDGVLIVDIEDNPKGLSNDQLLETGGQIVDSLEFASP